MSACGENEERGDGHDPLGNRAAFAEVTHFRLALCATLLYTHRSKEQTKRFRCDFAVGSVDGHQNHQYGTERQFDAIINAVRGSRRARLRPHCLRLLRRLGRICDHRFDPSVLSSAYIADTFAGAKHGGLIPRWCFDGGSKLPEVPDSHEAQLDDPPAAAAVFQQAMGLQMDRALARTTRRAEEAEIMRSA